MKEVVLFLILCIILEVSYPLFENKEIFVIAALLMYLLYLGTLLLLNKMIFYKEIEEKRESLKNEINELNLKIENGNRKFAEQLKELLEKKVNEK